MRLMIRPNKRMGQHFLTDHETIYRIVELSGYGESDCVLEIGPGRGALTIPLAKKVNSVVAVEKDRNLTRELRDKLDLLKIDNVQILSEDILRFNFQELPEIFKKRLKIIGNLPYNISSPFIEKLIKNRSMIQKAVLMFQLEFANRLSASPGGKEYGSLSVLIQYYAELFPIIEVSNDCFYPRPKVGSKVLAFNMEKPYPRRAEDEEFFKKVVKSAFSQRRKTILNSLKGSLTFSGDNITDALRDCSIDPTRRAETLGMEDFLNLASTLREK
ncbi:MAG: ribosomal RNA small subunit methyltransferase A [Deltaproteobacteria bacterium]|nr:ribosomal RNA small subunit methyltransferase A [Deltaproteobacteria bacterium]